MRKTGFFDQIATAEGYHELGMHHQAWDVLEKLPHTEWDRPEIVNLRLKICTGLEWWETGSGLAAKLMASGSMDYHATVADFHFAFARHLSDNGEGVKAKAQFLLCCHAWTFVEEELVKFIEILKEHAQNLSDPCLGTRLWWAGPPQGRNPKGNRE